MGARLVIRSIDGRQVEEEIAYPFDQDRVVIGRGRSADVRIPHRTVSELHAIVERTTDGYRLLDQGSTNGTWIGEQRLVPQRSRKLSEGDVVRLGVYALSFHTQVLVTAPLTADHTAELARQLLRRHMASGHEGSRPPRFVIIAGKPTGAHVDVPPPPSRLCVGRGETCQLQLDDPDVSREHMEIVHDQEGILVRDLDSKNGMTVCGKRQREARLLDGDELELGGCTLLFEEPAQGPLEAMEGAEDQPLAAPPPDLPPATKPEEAKTGTAAQQPSISPSEPAALAGPDSPPSRPAAAAKPKRTSGMAPDLLVYGLAGLVLALSVAGLVLLLGE